ncbi:MAG: response regulator [Nitrospirae bacterium]|nr:MAG: response regulator [Nitrospirota bacterium]
MTAKASSPHILVVDDDPLNRQVLAEYLEETGYELIVTEHGAAALAYVEQPANRVDAILLDWMMPEMDGMAFVRRMRDIEARRSIPIIMQTALGDPDRIREGLEAGVFYYLVKPFGAEILKAVVNAALRRFREHERQRLDLEEQAFSLTFMESATFRVRTLPEVHAVALLLAKACPDPDRIIMGLTDLLVNAVEHGNLEISYDEKTRLQEEERWEAEIEHRLTLPRYREKSVTVDFERKNGEIQITITDEGSGFDWKPYMELQPETLVMGHGRGIAMAKALAFDSMEYRDKGNVVVCRISERALRSGRPHDAASTASMSG